MTFSCFFGQAPIAGPACPARLPWTASIHQDGLHRIIAQNGQVLFLAGGNGFDQNRWGKKGTVVRGFLPVELDEVEAAETHDPPDFFRVLIDEDSDPAYASGERS